jgi:hypothetical protein
MRFLDNIIVWFANEIIRAGIVIGTFFVYVGFIIMVILTLGCIALIAMLLLT